MQEKLDQGWIKARAIIEILGKPKEHVEETLRKYVDMIAKNEKFEILKKEFAEPKEVESYWTVFVELEFLALGVENLVWFCFDYMPSVVEILAPEKLHYDSNEFSDFVNDLQARLHKMDLLVKSLKSENEIVKSNIDALLQNTMRLTLLRGPATVKEIGKEIGMDPKNTQRFLNQMENLGRVKKTDDKYSYVK